MADRNSLYALAVNAAAERSPFGHPLAEAELRAVYAAVDAVADDWYAVLADAHACGVCLDHTPDEYETERKDEEGDDR